MTIFRWIIGVLGGLMALGAVASFVIYVVADAQESLRRARALGRLAWAIALFWFNTEVWGRVVYVLVNWSR